MSGRGARGTPSISTILPRWREWASLIEWYRQETNLVEGRRERAALNRSIDDEIQDGSPEELCALLDGHSELVLDDSRPGKDADFDFVWNWSFGGRLERRTVSAH